MAILLAPLTLLRRNEVRLFLTSFAILFVELLLIRWIPSNVKYIGFFSNFLLIASFLGIGLGILLGRKGWSPRVSPFAVLLACVVLYVLFFKLDVQIKSSDELFFGLAESNAVDQNFLILPLIVALIVSLLATLALPLGPLLKSMPPLKAYAIDITGSLAGIASFTILSALGTNPVVWFSVGVIIVLGLELGRRLSLFSIVNVVALGAVLLLIFQQGQVNSKDIWSPYYRIDEFKDTAGVTQITVDGIPHQAMHPIGQAGLEPFYNQVYKWFPGRTYDNVLVVGAGTGSDVAIALEHGAGHVDAVEIDPKLLQIGAAEHPDHPYSDPRVTTYNNDGRAFLRTTDKKYDLVIFALPDSLTLVSQQSSVRLESFLFTLQAFETVRDHLSDRGHLRALQLLPRPVAGVQAQLHAHGFVRHGPALAPVRRQRRDPGRRTAGRLADQRPAAGRPDQRRAAGRRSDSQAGHGRLAVPVPAHAVHCQLLPGRPRDRAHRRAHRRGPRGQVHGYVHSQVQPAFLRARHRLPAAQHAQRDQLQPALWNDLDRQCVGLLRDLM